MAESGVSGATPDQSAEFNALADAAARWEQFASEGVGGGNSSNSTAASDVLSGFLISGGRSASQDSPDGGFDGLVPAVDAHYYRGYWAGVQSSLYAPFLPGSGGGISAIVAAIGRALVSPAEAGPRAFSERLLPVGVSGDTGGFGGGFNPVPPHEIFSTDSNSAGSGSGEPVTSADLAAELIRATEPSSSGGRVNWQNDLLNEIMEDGFLPYPGSSYRMSYRFFDINRFLDPSGRVVIGYTSSRLPLFPVYNYMFGDEFPPLYMGVQAVALSGDFTPMIPIFTWGDILPPEY